jgi:hypothetical protein
MRDVVEDEPKRGCLAARDCVLDGCDVEDVDRRIGRLGKAGLDASIRSSKARSPRNAAVKTSSLAPAVNSSDSTAARRLNRAAHSGVTHIT